MLCEIYLQKKPALLEDTPLKESQCMDILFFDTRSTPLNSLIDLSMPFDCEQNTSGGM